MNALRQLDEGIWTLDLPHSMLGVEIGTRSTIVRLASGGIWICSPGPFSEGQLQSIRELGPVEALVAPNTFHHLYLARAKEHFPRANVFLAPGLKEKVPTIPAGEVLVETPPSLWSGVLDQVLLRGTTTNEVVFLHRPSRSLIVTDLAFNLRKGGLLTRMAMALNGGFGRFGPTKVMKKTIHDWEAFRQSLETILDWDFDRVILAHGEIVERDGREALGRAFDVPTIRGETTPEGKLAAR